MIEVVDTLNTFASNEAAQPPEQVYVLSSSRPQDFQEAIDLLLVRIDALEEENKSLKETLETLSNNQLIQLRLINQLRHKPETRGPIFFERLERLEKYISARQDHKASFEQLKGFLQINDNLLNLTIKGLMKRYPGIYAITKDMSDKRRKWFNQINSLPK
jgi:hypothetical protein